MCVYVAILAVKRGSCALCKDFGSCLLPPPSHLWYYPTTERTRSMKMMGLRSQAMHSLYHSLYHHPYARKHTGLRETPPSPPPPPFSLKETQSTHPHRKQESAHGLGGSSCRAFQLGGELQEGGTMKRPANFSTAMWILHIHFKASTTPPSHQYPPHIIKVQFNTVLSFMQRVSSGSQKAPCAAYICPSS